VTVLGGLEYRSLLKERAAEQIAEQAKVEQGRQALLHDDHGEALEPLADAYGSGDHSFGTEFMFARAAQPLLAEQARFTAVAGHMWSAAFSPDGKQIVTTDDAGAQIWDAQTNRLRFTLPHGDTVYQAVYSADGARLITAVGDSTVRIWDTATGKCLHELSHGGRALRYSAVAISPDGKLVAAIDMAGAVADAWDATSGELLTEQHNDASRFPLIAFSADGRWLAMSGGNDVRVFDTSSWSQALAIAGPRVRALSFDPTGSRLVTGSAAGDASIWDIPSGLRAQHLRELGEPVNAVAFSPDGRLVATGDGGGAEQIWQTSSGELQSQLNDLRSKILMIEFDPTSKLVVAAASVERSSSQMSCSGCPSRRSRGREASSGLRTSIRPHTVSSVRAGTGRRGCGMQPRRIFAGTRGRQAPTAPLARVSNRTGGLLPLIAEITVPASGIPPMTSCLPSCPA